MNPADVARIAAALDAIDQAGPARRFRRDVVAAHLLATAQSRQLDLALVTSAMPDQSPDQASDSNTGFTAATGATSAAAATGTLTGAEVGQDGETGNSNEQGTPATVSGVAPLQQADDNSSL
jgi:hypothetical protein